MNKKSKLLFSFLYPSLFVILLWCIKLYEYIANVSLADYGLYPRTINGLIGIVTAPLIHENFSHLISNTVPLIISGSIIIYFYKSISFQVFFWVYLATGIWVWVSARNAYHIGASGLVYGFLSFLFFSGVFRKDKQLLALSLFVTFLYGGIVWGIFPLQKEISWESHLMGTIAGIITAYNFRKEGPPAPIYDFGDDEENENTDVSITETIENTVNSEQPISIHYNYVRKEKDDTSTTT